MLLDNRKGHIGRIPGSSLPGTREPALLPGHAALYAERQRCESQGEGRFDTLWLTTLKANIAEDATTQGRARLCVRGDAIRVY